MTYMDINGQPLNPPTLSVSYTYDPNYNRLATMIDGSGSTPQGAFMTRSPRQARGALCRT